MEFKNLHIILLFVTYFSYVLSLAIRDNVGKVNIQQMEPTEKLQTLINDFKVAEFRGNDVVDTILKMGGFNNDADLVKFVMNEMGFKNETNVLLKSIGNACTTFQIPNENGNGYFVGRNFDWEVGHGLVLVNHPDNGYSSVSTVNTDFISWTFENLSFMELAVKYIKNKEPVKQIPDELLRVLSLYAPLDGMNEKGLTIAINMLPFGNDIHQNNTNYRNLTTLSLVRVLLDKVATVDEAIEFLKETNYHTQNNVICHYHISDPSGKSVVVEFVNGKTVVNDANVITNFYIDKEMYNHGHGQDRYEIVEKYMAQYSKMNAETVRDTLKAAAHNTLWSIVYDKTNVEATYYFASNYEQAYSIKLNTNSDDDSDSDETVNVSDGEVVEEDDSEYDSEYDSSDEKTENEQN
ncbi:hypothetical protein PIROE2DRAFT_10136 [Piromyces sp. E2]|nr:hypothetical protein PIROE2DRAFT_10136 [Piromyces sp. E2]|eukprot:OUM63351.1 hypothetical protein PIROE2DRAFT_10136 [Piromyces sp. E2]